jgi:hypothetical protein
MNIGEVSEWVGISRSTVRKYLADFADIEGGFSQSALPGSGKHRRFTDGYMVLTSTIQRISSVS